MGDLRYGGEWTAVQRVKNDALYRAAMTSLWFGRKLGHRRRLAVGRLVGRLAEAAWARGRERAAKRLGVAYGGVPPVTTRDVFEALGEDLATSLVLLDPLARAGDYLPVSRQTMEVLERARARGRGVIFASAHLGPMELVAAAVAELGIPVNTLARESYDPRFTALYERMRSPRGVRTIYRGSPGAEVAVVRALRRGEVVGFPMDLVGRGMAAVTCSFLGEEASVPVGPARIALRTGAFVLAGTAAPRADGTMELTAEVVETGGTERDASGKALTGLLAQALDRRIRQLPAHWPWMH